jgi:prophage antirepressor-like protein
MNTTITNFQFTVLGHHDELITSNIRVVTLEGNPWFVAVDVVRCLGLEDHNISNHLSKVDSSEKRVLKRKAPAQADDSNNALITAIGGSKLTGITIISESGLYKLIMRSDKPQAKAFQDWVTKEVLPSIRKTGSYVTGQPSLQENPQMDPLDLMMAQAELLPKLIAEMREQRRLNAEQAKRLDAQGEALSHIQEQVAEVLEYASVYDFNLSHRLKLPLGQRSILGKEARRLTDAAGKLTKTKAFDGQATYPIKFLKQAAINLSILK